MSDRPKEDQSVPGETNKQVPEVPSIGQDQEPAGNGVQRPKAEKAEDAEGQTREPGYDEA